MMCKFLKPVALRTKNYIWETIIGFIVIKYDFKSTYHLNKCIAHLLQWIPGIQTAFQFIQEAFMYIRYWGHHKKYLIDYLRINNAAILR